MKKLLFALALLVIVTPAALADAPETEGPAAEVAPLEVVAPEAETPAAASADELDGNGLPLSPLEVATDRASSAYECPPSTTYCQQDHQCDSFCGGPGAGACERGCCYCSF